ncbi:MAG: carbohydrate binding family 9 domain-containing protein [Gemmatimonadaceae bacterium]|nr:carbohydrate binding family 9 domain-containing protein [Gemmatimonadaceae bacterium]
MSVFTRPVRPAYLAVASLLALAPRPASAQQNDATAATASASADARRTVPVPVARATGAIIVDGRLDEPAWADVRPVEMVMHQPVYLGTLTERTDVRIAYDDRFLYMGGRLYDSKPGEIRTNTFYRDAYSGDDLLAIVIDSYNDYETALWFVTNPAGARNDRTVSNDAVFGGGGMPMNSDWNSHWDVATTQDEQGWTAEFRIPLSTLRFQVVDGQVTMGFIVYRFIARKNERQTYPAIDPKWGGLAFAKPSQAQRVVLRGVRQARPAYVTPYLLGGATSQAALESPSSGTAAWRTERDLAHEAGVDVRYSPTSNLALDLTLNTDFAQVEADDQQVNLTRFPLFFPEKRQFFQERASTFEFATGGFADRLFHSRRIGLDDGSIVRLLGGARAVGRMGGLDYGVLSMQTGSRGTRSGENMSVVRLNQQVLNPYSSVGAMITSRQGSNGQDNLAAGLDAVLRPAGDEWITLKLARTQDEAVDEGSGLASSLLLARWERRRDDGLSYALETSRVGADFLPRLGFQLRTDFRQFAGNVQYKRFHDAASPVRSTAVVLSGREFQRLADGSAESRAIEPQFMIELKDGKSLWITGHSHFESVRDSFPVAGSVVVPGEYWFHGGSARLDLPRSGKFRGDFTLTAGEFYDGTRLSASANPAWNPSKYLELGGGYGFDRLRFAGRGDETTAHLARLKVQVALNTRVSVSTFAQYSSVADLAGFNARFRYNVREGTDLWVVYNEGLFTARDVPGEPRRPLSSGRTVMVKYTHTLIW